MPASTIYIKPDCTSLQSLIKMAQDFKKPISIPSFRLDDSISTQQGSHPSRNVKTLPMLTGRRNPQPFSLFGPSTPQPRVQSKPRFILKDHCLRGSQGIKFFLMPCEISGRLLLSTVSRHSWHVLDGTLTDASSSEPDVPLALSQTAAANGPPAWGHPTEHDLIRTFGGIAPSAPPVAVKALASIEPAAQAVAFLLGPLPPSHLQPESICLNSCGSGPGPRRSIPVAGLRSPATGLLSSSRSRPQVLPWPGLLNVPWLLLDGLWLNLSWIKYNTNNLKM